MAKAKVIVTTVPFGAVDDTPMRLLREAGVECVLNPLGRRLRADEVADVIAGFPVVIAGTESIPPEAISANPSLRAICRVGIGLDGVPLQACRQAGVQVSYTPDGPSPAVAELAVGQILDLLRGITAADRDLRAGQWNRITGRRVATSTIGVVGVGRIGKRLLRHLSGGFPGVRLLAHDIQPDAEALALPGVEWVDFGTLLRTADVVSLHVPLTTITRHMVGAPELRCMKPGAVLLNTSRGGVVDEEALVVALSEGSLYAAAVDVFEQEPYQGPLAHLPNALVTCHMGSMSADCRAVMEIEATREAIRIFRDEPLMSPVPESEYALAATSKMAES